MASASASGRAFGTASVNSTASVASGTSAASTSTTTTNGLRSSTASRHQRGQASVGSAPTSWQAPRTGIPKSSSNGSLAAPGNATSHGSPALTPEAPGRPEIQRQRSVSSASGAAVERASNWLQALAPRGEGRSREFLTSTLSGVATVASTAAQEVNGFIRDRGSRPNSLVATSPPPVGSLSPQPVGPVRRAAAPANAARLPKASPDPERPQSVHLPLTSSPAASPTQRSFNHPIQTTYAAREHRRTGSAASTSALAHSTSSHPLPAPQLQQPQPQHQPPGRVFSTPSPSHSPAPSGPTGTNTPLHASTASSSSKNLAASTSSRTQTPNPLGASRSRGQPYKIGFQPSGVRSDRTAAFLKERKEKAGEREKEEGRLGRRWAKLVDLHFNPSLASRPGPAQPAKKSTFDGAFDSLNPKEVWRGLKAAAGPSADEARKRAVEQSIVKWEPDSEVKKCRICATSFSLSNRKHHCRLCGRIVCSLPPSPPGLLHIQFELFGGDMEHLPAGFRRERCSLLLVADWKTGRGEEVDEGFVGWMALEPEVEGREQTFVKRHVRNTSTASAGGSPAGSAPGSGASTPLPQQPQEVQVRGIRVCRECWRIVSRKQIIADGLKPSRFARLYETLRLIQSEIDGILPDLDGGIRHADALLEAGEWDRIDLSDLLENHRTLLSLLAEYDTVTKQLASVQFGPPPPSPGEKPDDKKVGAVLLEGGQKEGESTKQAEEVKATIVRMASIYLAKCMSQVHSVGKLQRRILQKQSKGLVVHNLNDSSSEDELARELQPLLEQQAQLESFIAQANAQRKYDDSKALSVALAEIEREIERLTHNI